jgi:bifunctional N-acetylglucosamine-1-phosphate-uridyltransferase/glucosamine-1-phosphate-acetyltransferase GlmU-like protein
MSPAALNAKRRSRILVAGADPEQRAAVLHDLSEALPPDTQLGEADAVAEVLAQAPSSSVVMLAGDLGEVSAESLMHMLGSRHPRLPVVALGLTACNGSRGAASLSW